MFVAKRFLVPVDFSDVSRAAVSAALQLAAANQGEIWLLHSAEGMDQELKKRLVSAPDETVISDTISFDEHALKQAADEEKQRFAEAGRYLPDVPIHTHVTGGDWLDVALELVDEHQIDVIVSATRGKSGVKAWLLGTITEKLVAKAPCSVFVVKAAGYPYLRD